MKNKILPVVASLTLVCAMLASPALAEDQTLPDVENLVAEAMPDSTIKLTWDAVAGADSYTIYYGVQSISEDGASYESDVSLGNVTTHIVTDLTPGTTYYFSTAADDSTGTYLGSYNYSEEVSAVATATVTPIAEDEVAVIPDTPADTPSALDIFLEDDHPASSEQPAPTPTSLPQSGPATATLLLVSGAGAWAWKKFRK